MCLSRVTSIEREECEGEGWKVVYAYSHAFSYLYYTNSPNEESFDQYNLWISCEKRNPIKIYNSDWGSYNEYPSGFHVLLSETDAQQYLKYLKYMILSGPRRAFLKVVKVKYKNIVAKGNQDELPCIVVEQIYVEQPTETEQSAN